jgi:hypothetical protein
MRPENGRDTLFTMPERAPVQPVPEYEPADLVGH